MIVASYFDHNATTPVASEVLDAFTAALRDVYANPSSIHSLGQAARQRIEAARGRVAELLGCGPKDVVFTSGGTESDNLAILGTVRLGGAAGKHVITSAIEHPAVLNTCAQLEREGSAVTYLAPDSNGLVSPDAVAQALRPETVLVSVMEANNETGVVQPIRKIARVAHEGGALMHSDGVQAAGRIAVDVERSDVDLYSISGHKLCAPKGIGALYVRPGVKLQPLQFGGRHERERRAGTENVPGAVALGAAAERILRQGLGEFDRLASLRSRLEQGILDAVPDTEVNSGRAERIPNTSNIRFAGVEGESVVIALDLAGFAVSTGAACSSGAVQPSHVLTAMGLTPAEARSCVRFSVGFSNDEEQVDRLIGAVKAVISRLRKLSPVYVHA